MALLRIRTCWILVAALALAPLLAQDEEAPPPEQAMKPPVALTFTPLSGYMGRW